ncbi:MAG: roadblock/LC7 domain-containing protein [Candidatus Helarchaeota archaeon]
MEQQIMEILKAMTKKIQFVVLVDKSGLPIASLDTKTKERIDPSMETVIAGIGAAVLSLALSTSSVINQGSLKELIIRNETGSIIITDAGESAILIGIIPPRTGIESPIISLKTAASKIRKLKIAPAPHPKSEKTSDIFIPEID